MENKPQGSSLDSYNIEYEDMTARSKMGYKLFPRKVLTSLRHGRIIRPSSKLKKGQQYGTTVKNKKRTRV